MNYAPNYRTNVFVAYPDVYKTVFNLNPLKSIHKDVVLCEQQHDLDMMNS